MKIVSQSADQLVLQEGSASGMFVGGAFVAAGIVAVFALRSTTHFAPWIGLGLALIGAGIILLASSITVTANRTRNQLLYEKKRLIGAQNSAYSLSDVFRIETRKRWEIGQTQPAANEPPRQPMLVAQSVIVFKTGKELPLDHQKTSSTTAIGGVTFQSGQAKESAMANQVAEFLGVPFFEVAPPPMSLPGQVNIQF